MLIVMNMDDSAGIILVVSPRNNSLNLRITTGYNKTISDPKNNLDLPVDVRGPKNKVNSKFYFNNSATLPK